MVGVDETSKREVAAASSAGVARTSNCFSKMMMAAGAESPAVATQSAKTDILQKIEEQRGNNHEHEELEEVREEELLDTEEEENEDLEQRNQEQRQQQAKTPEQESSSSSSHAKMSVSENNEVS